MGSATSSARLQTTAFDKTGLHACDNRGIADTVTLKHTGPYDYMAQPGTAAVPTEVMTKAKAMVAAAQQLVEDAFAATTGDRISDAPEFAAELKLLVIDDYKAKLVQAAGLDGSVKKFAAKVAEGYLQNPVLCTMLAEVASLPDATRKRMFPPAGAARDRDVRVAVCYTFLLHGISMLWQCEPKAATGTFAAELLRRWTDLKKKVDWKPYFNLFERMKLPSINLFITNTSVPMKTGAMCPYAPSTAALMSLNILEACYQDYKLGHEANAACGYELLMEPCFREPLAGLGNKQSVEVDTATGTVAHFPPFPVVWANVYSSWNQCFVTQYADWPSYSAKLLHPHVLCTYQGAGPDDEGMYLNPRVVTLWAHIHRMIFQRAALKSATPPGLDWRNPLLTLLWGKVNEQAGIAFQRRVKQALDEHNGTRTAVRYKTKRLGVRATWAAIKGLVAVTGTIGELRDDACVEFAAVRRAMFCDKDEYAEATEGSS